MLQARFWLINTLQVSAKIQKDKEKAKGVELFLLTGWLLLLRAAEATLRLDWKDIPLRNTTLETILLSSFPSAQIIPTYGRTKKKHHQAKGPFMRLLPAKVLMAIKVRFAPLFLGVRWNFCYILLPISANTPQSEQACIVAEINFVYFHCLIKSCLNYQLCNEKSWLALRC